MAGSCKDKALVLVGRRPHFRQELRRKLLDRGFPPEEVESTLESLTNLGLLDDFGAAHDMAAGSLTRKGFGPRRMRHELLRRGAEETAVEKALAAIFGAPEEELRRAREIALKYRQGNAENRDRLARHLDRKGYSKGVILEVLGDVGAD